MLDTHRVHRWMLTLRDFTARELHHASGVKLSTVHTILNREAKGTLELVPALPGEQRRRGGQVRRYRLSAEGRAMLRAEVQHVRERLGVPGDEISAPAPGATTWDDPERAPTA